MHQYGSHQPLAGDAGVDARRGAAAPLGRAADSLRPLSAQGVPTAPSNLAFDQSLRARNPDWGLRDVAAVTAEAETQGLRFERLVEMPANNLILVFQSL